MNSRAAIALAAYSAAAALYISPSASDAQNYPMRAVKIILPYTPGGSTDVMARILSQKLTDAMGQQVIVDNRPGASGNIGTEIAVHSPADGYTLLMVTIPLVVNPSFYTNMPFDVTKDLAPVTLVTASPFVLVSHPSLPAKNVKELIELAKKQPGKLSYPSGGNGTNSHIAAELLNNLAGTKMLHVPYKGGGPALVSVLAGETSIGFLGIDVAVPHIKDGSLRGLGITSKKRSASIPDLPTIAEAGLPDYDFTSWYGVLAPSATPPAIVNAARDYIVKAMHAPDLTERFAKDGTVIVTGTPAQFGAYIKSEITRWAKVVKDSGLTVN